MKISVFKSANEVNIGPLHIKNEKIAKMLITLNDMKNNLKRRRYTHWVRVSFQGLGSIELGDEPVCIGDYDEYPIAPDTKVIIPIGEGEKEHKQYVCSTLNTAILLQNKTLTENEEIIVVYTEEFTENSSRSAVNEMLLNAIKRCLFEYQMKAYRDYEGEGLDREIFDKRISQILNILPDLERLIKQEGSKQKSTKKTVSDPNVEEITEYYEENAFVQDEEQTSLLTKLTESIEKEIDEAENMMDEEISVGDKLAEDHDTDDDTEDYDTEYHGTEDDDTKYHGTEDHDIEEETKAFEMQENTEADKSKEHEEERFISDDPSVRWVKINIKGNNEAIQ